MIALFGPPGSGKTVQGQIIARKHGWKWISMRDLCLATNDKDISLALSYGMNVDGDKSARVLRAAIEVYKAERWGNAILDGFPTSVAQIYWLRENNYLKELEGAIVLRVPKGELWKRLIERGRVDDTRAGIERRMDLYNRSITGMIHVLRENGIRIEEVDGGNQPKDVTERIEEKLAEWKIINIEKFA